MIYNIIIIQKQSLIAKINCHDLCTRGTTLCFKI